MIALKKSDLNKKGCDGFATTTPENKNIKNKQYKNMKKKITQFYPKPKGHVSIRRYNRNSCQKPLPKRRGNFG